MMHHEDIVSGIRVPEELKTHSEPIPYEHPHRETATKFVTEVHRRNKFEGIRMSEKYLGVGEGGKTLHPNALPPERRVRYADVPAAPKKLAASEPVEKAFDPNVQGVHQRSMIPHQSHPNHEDKNSSVSGDSVRSAHHNVVGTDKKARLETAKMVHRFRLGQLKSMPKPNLPKSELDKSAQPALVSSPLVINNGGATTTSPKIIDSPNVLNPYMNKSEDGMAKKEIKLDLKALARNSLTSPQASKDSLEEARKTNEKLADAVDSESKKVNSKQEESIVEPLKDQAPKKLTEIPKSPTMEKTDPKTRLPGVLLDKTMPAPASAPAPAPAPAQPKMGMPKPKQPKMPQMKLGAGMPAMKSVEMDKMAAAPDAMKAKKDAVAKCMQGLTKGMKSRQAPSMEKDNKPHPAGSPEERSHAVVENGVPLKTALDQAGSPERQSKLMGHLRTLTSASKLRSPGNKR